ncbi:MAG: ribose 5-phosphate isomerase B [Nanoarchaeota archaeon]
MEKEQIPIAGDHPAFELKAVLIDYLKELGFEPIDLGTYSKDSVDYPLYSIAVAEKISRGKYKRGIVLCKTGIGVSIAANKYPRVRCALVASEEIAELTRKHNDSNVLALGAGFISNENAKKIVKKWLNTGFEGGRHQRRLDIISQAERTMMHELEDHEKKEIKISASLMCADQLNLLDDVNKLITAGIDMFHIDIVDGLFAQNITMNPSQVFSLRSHTNLPIDVHLMVKDPSVYIPRLAAAGVDIVVIQTESKGDIGKLLDEITKNGMQAGLAIEAETPVKKMFPYLDKIDFALFLAVKTGFKAQPFVPEILKKMEQFNEKAKEQKVSIQIMVDGSVGPRTITHLYRAGARIFIGGTSGLFKQGTFEENIRQMKSYCY